ncbi:MAG: UbiA family prenyltransferase [Candidatus Kariarchaeaceae archaeon]
MSVIKASHPFSVLMASVTGGIISWKAESDYVFVSKITLIIVLAQLLTGFVNDYLDYPSDVIYQASKPVVQKVVKIGDLRQAIWIILSVLVICSILILPLRGIVVVFCGVFIASLYNLGLKDTPFSTLVFAIAFGLMGALPFVTLNRYDPWPFQFIMSGAVIAISIQLTNDLVDIDADTKRGAKPLTVVLGQNITQTIIIILTLTFMIIQIDQLLAVMIEFFALMALLAGFRYSSFKIRETVYYIVAISHVVSIYLIPLS